jgi:hypothetical protein
MLPFTFSTLSVRRTDCSSRLFERDFAHLQVFDAAGNVIETHEHKGDFKEW